MGNFLDNTLGTNIFGSNAFDDAAAAQEAATNRANNTLGEGFSHQQSILNPWVNGGTTAFQQMAGGNVLSNFQGDPGYQFRLNEGNKAINASMAARGMGNSGAALKALQRYGQDYASNEYNNAYNREFNRLNTVAGYGQNATNTLNNAIGNWAQGVSNNYMGLGNAQAAAGMAQANQQSNMAGQLIQGGAAIFSDKRLKKNIKPITKEEHAEMGKILRGYHFNYLSDEHGSGDWIGVMAQDLENHPIGKTLVVETPEGIKTIDRDKLLSMFLAYFAEAA